MQGRKKTMESLEARPDIINLIKKVSVKNGLEKFKITDVNTNAKGEGYVGEIFMVDIESEEKNSPTKNLNIVVKSAFSNEQFRLMFPIHTVYENEICFYTEIYPEFRKLENDHKAALGPDLIPKIYDVCSEDRAEILILENLKTQSFEMFPQTAIMDHSHIKLIFETYGRYHAYSLALKDQKPELYERLTGKIQNVYAQYVKAEFFVASVNANMALVCNLLTSDEDKAVRKHVEGFQDGGWIDFYTKASRSDCEYPVIVHGDCWSNNMMFKYEDDAKKIPVDIRLLDFQLLRVGSPVCDLSYIFYTGASKPLFDKLDDYLTIYHASLSKCLRALGSDPEKLFPFEVLKKQWLEFSKFGLFMAIMMIKTKLTYKEELPDFAGADFELDMEKFAKIGFREEEYAARVRQVLNHFLEVGALG